MSTIEQRMRLAERFPKAITYLPTYGQWAYASHAIGGHPWLQCAHNDPFSDLNAIHEVENELTPNEWTTYADELQQTCYPSKYQFATLHANTDQRGAALLKLL